MSSPRNVLLTAVQACLARIKVVDGYSTDAGNDVTLEPAPRAAADDSAAFVAVLWQRQDRPSEPAMVRAKRLTTISVVARVPASSANAQATLDALTGDIEKAMADQSFRYPVGYQNPQYQSSEPLVPSQPNLGWIGVAITYTSHIPIT